MGATVEAVGQFLLRAGAVIFVLWCVNYFLHDTIAETWHGMVRAVSQLAQLNPSPRAVNLIGALIMLAVLLIFSRGSELDWFSLGTIRGEPSITNWVLVYCGLVLVGVYVLLCIRTCRDT